MTPKGDRRCKMFTIPQELLVNVFTGACRVKLPPGTTLLAVQYNFPTQSFDLLFHNYDWEPVELGDVVPKAEVSTNHEVTYVDEFTIHA